MESHIERICDRVRESQTLSSAEVFTLIQALDSELVDRHARLEIQRLFHAARRGWVKIGSEKDRCCGLSDPSTTIAVEGR